MRMIQLFLAFSLVVSLQPVAFGRSAAEEGIMSYQKRQYQSAQKQFLKATAANPTDPTAQYYLANTYVKLGQHTLAQKHYRLASLLDPGGTYGTFAETALRAYSRTGSSEIHSNAKRRTLPDSHFAVARITSPSEATDENGQSSQLEIPQQYPQVAGYDAERSYLYQHGLWQAYGGPINTQLPAHTTTHDARDYGINHHHDPIIVRRSY